MSKLNSFKFKGKKIKLLYNVMFSNKEGVHALNFFKKKLTAKKNLSIFPFT